MTIQVSSITTPHARGPSPVRAFCRCVKFLSSFLLQNPHNVLQQTGKVSVYVLLYVCINCMQVYTCIDVWVYYNKEKYDIVVLYCVAFVYVIYYKRNYTVLITLL